MTYCDAALQVFNNGRTPHKGYVLLTFNEGCIIAIIEKAWFWRVNGIHGMYESDESHLYEYITWIVFTRSQVEIPVTVSSQRLLIKSM